MYLNLSKTKSILIGSHRKLANISSISLFIFDCNIDSVNTFKYLGIILATDFTWSDHVEHVITKVNQRLSLLSRIKHFFPLTARLLFYDNLILPIFGYADVVWGDKNNVSITTKLGQAKSRRIKKRETPQVYEFLSNAYLVDVLICKNSFR